MRYPDSLINYIIHIKLINFYCVYNILTNKNILERFHSKIELGNNGCHNWVASKDRDGYGWFWNGVKNTRTHRFSYELYKGQIPKGLVIDHLCKNTSCVNPDHLEVVTSGENTRRGVNYHGTKTHCKNGHEFTPENTYVRPKGYRTCRKCCRIYDTKRYSKLQ